MASDGLSNKAKSGTCRMCLRVRNTEKYLKAVGEVRHGFATGHIWECHDIEDCNNAINLKLNTPGKVVSQERIKYALRMGRFKEYKITV